MQDGLTIDMLRACADTLRKHVVPPCVVKTQHEADELTRNDPLWRTWNVGDKYYRVDTLRGTMAATGEEGVTMTTLCIYEAALFNREPAIGEINPPGEVSYTGYRRVPIFAEGGANVLPIIFPPSEEDGPALVTHIAALDGQGRVVGVRNVCERDLP